MLMELLLCALLLLGVLLELGVLPPPPQFGEPVV